MFSIVFLLAGPSILLPPNTPPVLSNHGRYCVFVLCTISFQHSNVLSRQRQPDKVCSSLSVLTIMKYAKAVTRKAFPGFGTPLLSPETSQPPSKPQCGQFSKIETSICLPKPMNVLAISDCLLYLGWYS